jgi:Zn-finger nucleic acid-binding protein
VKCPNCADSALVMSDRQGVEIDYCPTCRGIWLDRGELDKILERASLAVAPSASSVPPAAQASHHRKQPDFEDSDYRSGYRSGQYRKKSWLNELFD